MERRILFRPAFDKTHPDPKQNYGVGDLNIYFMLVNDDRLVAFQLFTGWYLPHVMKRRLEHMKHDVFMGKADFLLETWLNPKPADVFYTSPVSVDEDYYWEDGWWGNDDKSCYYGYKYEEEESGMYTTDHIFSLLIEKGDEALWEYLENYYREVFGND